MAKQLEAQTAPSLKVLLQYEIPLSRISDLLCSAIEGGSNYWYFIEEHVRPSKFIHTDEAGPDKYPYLYWPLNPDGAIVLSDMSAEGEDAKKRYTLNREAIAKGFSLMAEKTPRHFADFMSENDDSVTADVFLQLCCFGEVLYD